ncbi:hypothetical protein A8M56_19860 [Yersinia pestis]|nr:hypothetical protein A8M56_19860 [Yersinia pestis]
MLLIPRSVIPIISNQHITKIEGLIESFSRNSISVYLIIYELQFDFIILLLHFVERFYAHHEELT